MFSVTPLGGACYTIGIEAPIGQAAVQPNISIVYNSQTGNSVVGWGASLSGISAITRGPRTVYADGKAGAINHDDNDAFYLDGERLVLREHIANSDSSVYCLENNPFVRVVLHGLNSSSQSDMWFSVLDRNGVSYEYGNGSGQQSYYHLGVIKVNTWYITKCTDSRNNYMTYYYSNNNNYTYPYLISYGQNSNNGAVLVNQLEFSFENRPDTMSFSLEGTPGYVVRRLKTITTKTNGAVYRTYTLNYSTGIGTNPTQVSRLVSVDMANGNNESMEPIILSWQGLPAMSVQEQALPVSTTSLNGTVDYDNSYYSCGDLNGDGLVDILENGYVISPFGNSNNYHFYRIHTAYLDNNGNIAFSKGDERYPMSEYYFSPDMYQWYYTPTAIDVDGDGINEMVVPERKETPDENHIAFRFYGNFGCKSGMQYELSTSGNENYCYAVGDLNNDGSSEIVVIEKHQESSYYVGAVMGAETLDNTFCRPLRFSLANEPRDIFIADMNLDGLADVVVFHSGGYSVYWNDGTWLDSHTQTFTPSVTAYSLSITPKRSFLGDFNGDGITDFLITVSDDRNWYFELGRGDGTMIQKTACSIDVYDQGGTTKDNNELACYVYDMDGDGKSDVVICKAMYIRHSGSLFEHSYYRYNKTYTYWMRSTGESLQEIKVSSSVKKTDASQQYYILGDFNGDGLPELVNNGYDCYNGNDANVSPTWHIYKNTAYGVAANKISCVTDGWGNTTNITYKPLTDTNVYSRQTETTTPESSIIDCPPLLHVVSSITYNDGDLGPQTEEYKYGGLKANLQGKGLLGMSYVNVSNSARGTSTKSGVKKWNSESLLPERTYERQFLGNDSSYCEIKYTSDKPYLQKAWFTHPDTTYIVDMDGNLSSTITRYSHDTGDLFEKTEKWNDGASRITTYYDYYYYNGQRLPSNIQSERYLPHNSDLLTWTHIEYNSCGLKTLQIDNDNTSKPLTHQYTYDGGGNVLTETVSGSGVITNTKTYVYDISKRFVKSVTETANGQSLFSSYTYDTWGNLLTEKRRATGNNPQITTHYYDGWGFRTRTEYPTGQVSTYKKGWGSTSSQCYYLLEQGTATPWVKTWYDSKGRKTSSESYTALDVHSVHTWQYDNRGNLTLDRLVTGNLVQADNYAYDSRNRVSSFYNSEGRHLTYTYGNRTVNTTDGANRSYEKTFNPRGNVLTSSDPSGTVAYTYDADGKPLTITAHNATVTIGYDDRGNRVSLVDPDAGTMNYDYDALGRIISQTDARNNTTTFTYDGFGNLAAKAINNQPYASYTWSYTGSTAGLLISESAGGSTVSYVYDTYDRISSKTYTLTGTSLNQPLQYSYTYDANGLLSGLSYPGGLNVSYVYDSYGNKIRTTAAGTTVWELSYYDGMTTVADHTSQISSGVALESNGVLSELALVNGYDLPGYLSFTYDTATGNLLSRGNISGNDEYYTYDNLDRLTSADGNTFTYADNGNLTYKTGIGHYTYGSTKPHAVTGIENTARLMALSQLDTEFNEFGKISHITDFADGLNMEFFYGPDDERFCTKLKKANGSLKKETVYLDNLDIVISNTGSKQWFYYVDDHVISKKVDNGTFSHYFTFTDQLGSILKAVDASGTERFSATYDAWGRQTVTLNEIGLIRGYTGHEMLTEFGLINMNGRVYDPLLGRFLSTDNFVQEPDGTQSFNRYSYCLNNPLKYTDPSGEWFGIDDFVVAAASFVVGYVSSGISSGNWGWSSVKSGITTAAMSWLGYNTAGLSTGVITNSTWNSILSLGTNTIVNMLVPSFTIPIGNFSISISPAFGFGEGGLNFGLNFGVGYSDGNWNFGVIAGFGSTYQGWYVEASYKGAGLGYGITYYNNTTIGDYTSGRQKVGTGKISWGDVSFSLSNDLFAEKQDRWRTSAAELAVGNFVIGTSVFTNNAKEESIGKHIEENDPIVGAHYFDKKEGITYGSWETGQVFSTPFWVGYKNGNQVFRVGVSSLLAHSLTQNLVHKFMHTPYFIHYNNFKGGAFSYYGYYNPLTLWNN